MNSAMIFQLLPSVLSQVKPLKSQNITTKKHVVLAVDWLKRAQDVTPDGGVSAWYSLLDGWSFSYIETTGYIIETFLKCSEYLDDPDLKTRASRMADFLLEMQLDSGGFRTVVPAKRPVSQPTIFNTGQDLLGTTEIFKQFKQKKYLDSIHATATFLCDVQQDDGSWLQYTFGSRVHTYHSRVAWALLKAHQHTNSKKHKQAALKHLDWVVANQLKSGWFKYAELPGASSTRPYTHSISYVLEGLLESASLLPIKTAEPYWRAVELGAKKLATIYLENNFMPATFDKNWDSPDRYSCLTGNAQLAYVWLRMYRHTQKHLYLKAASNMLEYLRIVQLRFSNSTESRGSLPGSDPIWGTLLKNQGYCRLAFINWSTKFFIDALILEDELRLST